MKKLQLILLASLLTLAACAQPTTTTLTLASYNVRNGWGIDQNRDLTRSAAVISNMGAQVIALQELDSITARSNGVDVLRELASLTGMHGTYARAIEYDGGAYGIGMLSKDKPLAVKRMPLPGSEEQRVLLIGEFENYVVFCTHFSLTESDQLLSIDIIANEAQKYTKPLFLMGDLNFAPNTVQALKLGAKFTLLSSPPQPTYPANSPTVTIDYIYGSLPAANVIESKVVNAPSESDHRPILVTVKL